jgi:sucrose synthase
VASDCDNVVTMLSLYALARFITRGQSKPILMPHHIQDLLQSVCDEVSNPTLKTSDFGCVLNTVHEAVVISPRIALALRAGIGEWHYLRINADDMTVEEMSVSHYLAFKEKLALSQDGYSLLDRHGYDPFVLEFDMKPFTANQPKITLESSIGNGVAFLNKTLSAKMFGPAQNAAGTQQMLDFLRGFKHDGSSLLLSHRMNNVSKLRHALVRAERLLDRHEEEELISNVAGLDELGFLPGWGATVGRVRESFQLLLDLIQAPDAETLERFLSRLPLVFKVVILSPHGYFGQHNVLGMPDTGGQVCIEDGSVLCS